MILHLCIKHDSYDWQSTALSKWTNFSENHICVKGLLRYRWSRTVKFTKLRIFSWAIIFNAQTTIRIQTKFERCIFLVHFNMQLGSYSHLSWKETVNKMRCKDFQLQSYMYDKMLSSLALDVLCDRNTARRLGTTVWSIWLLSSVSSVVHSSSWFEVFTTYFSHCFASGKVRKTNLSKE